jgi:hypothetical protein
VVETEYQSPTVTSDNDAWILAHDAPAEVIALDGDVDGLDEE